MRARWKIRIMHELGWWGNCGLNRNGWCVQKRRVSTGSLGSYAAYYMSSSRTIWLIQELFQKMAFFSPETGNQTARLHQQLRAGKLRASFVLCQGANRHLCSLGAEHSEVYSVCIHGLRAGGQPPLMIISHATRTIPSTATL